MQRKNFMRGKNGGSNIQNLKTRLAFFFKYAGEPPIKIDGKSFATGWIFALLALRYKVNDVWETLSEEPVSNKVSSASPESVLFLFWSKRRGLSEGAPTCVCILLGGFAKIRENPERGDDKKLPFLSRRFP